MAHHNFWIVQYKNKIADNAYDFNILIIVYLMARMFKTVVKKKIILIPRFKKKMMLLTDILKNIYLTLIHQRPDLAQSFLTTGNHVFQ